MRKKTRSRLNPYAKGKVLYSKTITDDNYVATIRADDSNMTRKELSDVLDEHRR